jgi:nucleoid-associated protein YgaU
MPKKVTTKKEKIDMFHFGESYSSLLLGIVIIIAATALLLSFIHNKTTNIPTSSVVSQEAHNTVQISPEKLSFNTPMISITQKNAQNMFGKKVWVVKENESLWSIADKIYQNGDKWVDIARANNLADPWNIHVDDKLILPAIQQETPKETPTVLTNDEQFSQTVQSNVVSPIHQVGKITGSSYTVIKEDNLWDIAVRAYGDGYRWVAIAQANNLANPSIIHLGNVLTIPR